MTENNNAKFVKKNVPKGMSIGKCFCELFVTENDSFDDEITTLHQVLGKVAVSLPAERTGDNAERDRRRVQLQICKLAHLSTITSRLRFVGG
jgi:hypothetical protein